jgi:hypothetical protein
VLLRRPWGTVIDADDPAKESDGPWRAREGWNSYGDASLEAEAAAEYMLQGVQHASDPLSAADVRRVCELLPLRVDLDKQSGVYSERILSVVKVLQAQGSGEAKRACGGGALIPSGISCAQLCVGRVLTSRRAVRFGRAGGVAG